MKVGLNIADSHNSAGGCTYYATGPSGMSDVRSGLLVMDLRPGGQAALADERRNHASARTAEVNGLGPGAFEVDFPSRQGSQSACFVYFSSGGKLYSLQFMSNVPLPRTDCEVARDSALVLLK